MPEYILVFDSGGGGKFVLEELKKVLPQENFLLFCDEYNCPYGNKTFATLKKIVLENLSKLLEAYRIKIVVIACNTISSMFKEDIKKIVKRHFDLNKHKKNIKDKLFYKKHCPVLFVEPQLNYNILQNPTLILGTSNTIKYNKKVRLYRQNAHLFVQGFGSLAHKIDNAKGDFSHIKNTINRHLSKFKKRNIKNVVLACTHYNLIKKEIKSVLGEDIKFFENSRKTALKTQKIVENQHKNASKLLKKEPILHQNESVFLNKI